DPQNMQPSDFHGPPLVLEHHTAAMSLTFRPLRIRFGSWEDEVPAEAAAITAEILEEGRVCTIQNFPIVDFSPVAPIRDIWVSEPALRWNSTDGDDLRTYTNIVV